MHSRYTLTFRSAFCCSSHGVLRTFPIRPTPSRSSRSPTPRHLCTSTTAPYISLLPLMHTAFRKQIFFAQDLPGCSDSTGLGCIEHLRRVSVRSRHSGVCHPRPNSAPGLLPFRQGFTVDEPSQVQLGLPLAPSALGAHLLSEEPAVVAAPTAVAAVFSSAAPVRCKPCCATRKSCVVCQGLA